MTLEFEKIKVCRYLLAFVAVLCVISFLYQLGDDKPKNTHTAKLLQGDKANPFADVSLAEINNQIQKEEDNEGFSHPRFTREKLGHMSWTLLHLISAYTPEVQDNQTRADLNQFLWLFAKYYPCKVCSGHFMTTLKTHKYEGNDRKDFMDFMCKLHNIVNVQLNKPVYPCDLAEKAWGQIGCGCEPEELLKNSLEEKNGVISGETNPADRGVVISSEPKQIKGTSDIAN